MLHLYSLWLGESKPFFRPADSTKMQNVYDYWDTILTAAANLRMELFHYLNYQDPNSPAGNAAITNFVGNPDLSPPATGTFQGNETANLKLTFPAVPVGTVINARDHIMWIVQCQSNSAAYTCPTDVPPQVPDWNDAPVLAPISWNGITGWTSPSVAEFQSLIAGWSGSNPNIWLAAQTKAEPPDSPSNPGFADLTADCGYPCAYVWTSTQTGPHSYDIMDLRLGTPDVQSPWDWVYLKRSLDQGEQYYWYQ